LQEHNILPESGFSENVSVPEFAGWLRQGQRQPAVLEGELPGGPGNAHRAIWLPGHCGLPSCSCGGTGPLANREVARVIARSQPAASFGKCGAPSERCRATASHSAASRRKGKAGIHVRCGPGGWPGPHSIF